WKGVVSGWAKSLRASARSRSAGERSGGGQNGRPRQTPISVQSPRKKTGTCQSRRGGGGDDNPPRPRTGGVGGVIGAMTWLPPSTAAAPPGSPAHLPSLHKGWACGIFPAPCQGGTSPLAGEREAGVFTFRARCQ